MHPWNIEMTGFGVSLISSQKSYVITKGFLLAPAITTLENTTTHDQNDLPIIYLLLQKNNIVWSEIFFSALAFIKIFTHSSGLPENLKILFA